MCYICINLATFILFSVSASVMLLYFQLVQVDESFVCDECINEDIYEEYDFIIVGAGTAGSAIAGLLSANTNYKILILEAGSNGTPFFDIPFIGPMLQGTDFDWQYETVPQKNACLALHNQVSKWPSGKIVGGSSRLNNMMFVKGHDDDYADWFSPSVDHKKEIPKIFKKIESYLPVNDILYSSKLGDIFIQSGLEAGYTFNSSYLGFHKVKVNQINGTRTSTSHIHLRDLNKDSNLTLLTNSILSKLLIRKKHVYGVKFIKNNKVFIKRCRKAVILSAGVIGTPKILMLSGIGPKDHLEKLGISVIKDLPVGKNLQDHVTTGIDLIMVNNDLQLSILDMMSPKSIYNYYVGNGGPWSTPGCEAIAFFNSLDDSSQPDLQLMALPLGITKDAGAHLHKLFGILPNIWNNYFHSLSYENMITILPIVLHPKSKGTVELASSDYRDKPLIDPKYLSNEDDIEVLIKGIRIIQKLLDTPSMKSLNAKIINKHFPGCENFIFDTDEYWECYIRHMTLTSYHPGGTCKMGSIENSDIVVDRDTFKVKGFENLMVADASVFPNLPSGNINAAVMMIAEKIVKYILEGQDFAADYQTCHIKHVFINDLKCAVKNWLYY